MNCITKLSKCMKNLITLNWATMLLLTLTCFSCERSLDSELPPCIQEIIDADTWSHSIETIRVQKVKKELHYWMNTGVGSLDGREYFLNSQCDTICWTTSFNPSVCDEDYDHQKWQTIWPE